MSRLRPIKARELRRALERLGYIQQPGRGKGAHLVMAHPSKERYTTLSWHGGAEQIPKGTLKQILSDIGLTWDELETYL
ncbi:MAG: type II toxin-antitoxin system HicA family toxin [Candidatus Thermoplasmatota archaeon]